MTTFDELAAGFARSAIEIVGGPMRDLFRDTADEVKRDWQDNIRAVAPRYLPHAPKSITYDTHATGGAIIAEVGAVEGRKQADLVLGNELGSRNTPAHLSGQKAAEPAALRLSRRSDSVIAHLLP